MELIRIIAGEYYDVNLGRFQSWVFSNSGDNGGISVISRQCMVETTGNVCGHIRRYYSDLGGGCPVFWQFSAGDLPSDCELEQEDSPTGDRCHYNIKHLSNNKAGRLFKRLAPDLRGIYVCIDGDERLVQVEDLSRDALL